MLATKNGSRSRSPATHFPQKASSSATNLSGPNNNNAKIMSLTSYIFSGLFQKKSTANASNEISLAQEYRDAGKFGPSKNLRSSENPASNKHKVQQGTQYQENPNYKSNIETTINVAYRASTNQLNGVLSTSKPDGSISAKNIRSVRVSQSAPTHSKHFVSNSHSTLTTTASNSSESSSLSGIQQLGKSSYSQNKSTVTVLPSITDSCRDKDTEEYSNNSVSHTRKTSGVNTSSSSFSFPFGNGSSAAVASSSSSSLHNATTSSSSSSSSGSSAAINTAKKPLCCDKCDGKHETDDCPYYKKKREDHPDAQRNGAHKLGGTSLLPGGLIMRAKVRHTTTVSPAPANICCKLFFKHLLD